MRDRRAGSIWAALCLACTAVFALCSAVLSTGTASAVLSLAYAGSEQGLAPNGTRLSMALFSTQACGEAILEKASLAQTLSVAQLDDIISLAAVVDDDTPTTDYISAAVRVTAKVPLRLRGTVDAKALVAAAADVYTARFAAAYLPAPPTLAVDELDALSCGELADTARLYTQRAAHYLDYCARQGAAGTDAVLARIDAFTAGPLAGLTAHQHSADAQLSQLQAVCSRLERSAAFYTQKSEAYRDILARYGGPERLIRAASVEAAQAAGQAEALSAQQRRLDALLVGSAQQLTDEAVITGLEDIAEAVNSVAVPDCLVVTAETPPLWRRCHLPECLCLAAAVCIAGWLLCRAKAGRRHTAGPSEAEAP